MNQVLIEVVVVTQSESFSVVFVNTIKFFTKELRCMNTTSVNQLQTHV